MKFVLLFGFLSAFAGNGGLVLDLCDREYRVLGIESAAAPVPLPAKTAEAVAEITHVIDGLLEKAKGSKQPLVLATARSECNECSGKLQNALVPLGYTVQRFMVDTMGEFPAKGARIVRSDGTTVPFPSEKGVGLFYHLFLTFPAAGRRPPIIVDSTYLQFFDAEFAKTQKPVFVGTEEQLLAYFRKNREHVRVSTFHDPTLATVLTLEDPDFWVRSMYGMDGGIGERKSENVAGARSQRN